MEETQAPVETPEVQAPVDAPVEAPAVPAEAPVEQPVLDSVEQANVDHAARLDQDGPTGGIYQLPEEPTPAKTTSYLGKEL